MADSQDVTVRLVLDDPQARYMLSQIMQRLDVLEAHIKPKPPDEQRFGVGTPPQLPTPPAT